LSNANSSRRINASAVGSEIMKDKEDRGRDTAKEEDGPTALPTDANYSLEEHLKMGNTNAHVRKIL